MQFFLPQIPLTTYPHCALLTIAQRPPLLGMALVKPFGDVTCLQQ